MAPDPISTGYLGYLHSLPNHGPLRGFSCHTAVKRQERGLRTNRVKEREAGGPATLP